MWRGTWLRIYAGVACFVRSLRDRLDVSQQWLRVTAAFQPPAPRYVVATSPVDGDYLPTPTTQVVGYRFGLDPVSAPVALRTGYRDVGGSFECLTDDAVVVDNLSHRNTNQL